MEEGAPSTPHLRCDGDDEKCRMHELSNGVTYVLSMALSWPVGQEFEAPASICAQ